MTDLTPAQQRVKPGDIIKVRNDAAPYTYRVIRVHADGAEVYAAPHVAHVLFIPWPLVDLPDPPKAKPGVRYRSRTTTRNQCIGLADGALFDIGTWGCVEFNPDEWEEVEL